MKLRNVLAKIVGTSVAVTALTAPHAVAATPYWNNTKASPNSQTVRVYPCSGDPFNLAPGQKTTRNVCGVRLPVNRYIFAYVLETGTILLDTAECNRDRRINFTTSTDSSRTVQVIVQTAYCA